MSQEPAPSQDPTPVTPPEAPAARSTDPPARSVPPEAGREPAEARQLTGYAPAPPMRSAYPTAAEGGFHPDPIDQPTPHTPPGPGYGQAESQQAPAPAAGGVWMLLPVLLALVLGLGTLLALSQWPAPTTVTVGVLGLAAAVLSWLASAAIRRSVLIVAAGPVGVLIGYWVMVFFRG